MNAIDNTNMLDYRANQGTTGFEPAVTFAYDADAKEVDFTDSSDFPNGVALKKVKVSVHDKNGDEVRGEFGPGTGSDSGTQSEVTLDVSSLDSSHPFDIRATVIADDDQLVADGGAYNIGAAGSIGNWDKQRNAKTVDA